MEQWGADIFVGRQPRFARKSRDHDRRSLFWLHGWRGLELRRRDCVIRAVAASLCEARAAHGASRLQRSEVGAIELNRLDFQARGIKKSHRGFR